jgi:hypothetical protein
VAGAGPRRSTARRAALVLLLVCLGLGAAAFVDLSSGVHDAYPRRALLSAAGRERAPAWTRPCAAIARWTDEASCVHVRGRVVWVEHHDPDGDGDRHLLVMARRRIHIVKVARALPIGHLPGVGDRIDAVGYDAIGGHGRTELDALRLNGAERPG